MKIQSEVEFVVSQYGKSRTTLDDLIRLKESGVPGDAGIKVRVSKGDRPWESDQVYFGFEWEEER